MFVLMLTAATAVPAPAMPHFRSPQGEARTVVERQLLSPARPGKTGGISAEEAELIMQHHLNSIGQALEPGEPTGGQPASPPLGQPQP